MTNKPEYHTFRVKLAALPVLHQATEVYLDDKLLRGVKSINIFADAESMTTVELTLYANVTGAVTVAEAVDNAEPAP